MMGIASTVIILDAGDRKQGLFYSAASRCGSALSFMQTMNHRMRSPSIDRNLLNYKMEDKGLEHRD
jgi:hypothetical protein